MTSLCFGDEIHFRKTLRPGLQAIEDKIPLFVRSASLTKAESAMRTGSCTHSIKWVHPSGVCGMLNIEYPSEQGKPPETAVTAPL